jgi:hypothetical protein
MSELQNTQKHAAKTEFLEKEVNRLTSGLQVIIKHRTIEKKVLPNIRLRLILPK